MRLGRTLGGSIAAGAAMSAVMFGFLLTGDTRSDHPARGPVYEGTATVVEAAGRPALVCGAVRDGEPPACLNGLAVEGLDWSALDGHRSGDGARWAVARLTARYDGRHLVLTGDPVTGGGAVLEDAVHFGTPCDPPPGGWAVRDPALTGEAALGNLGRYAARQRDLARRWVDRQAFPGVGVQNLAFTGDLDRHRAEVSELWGGPFCVVEGSRTIDSLERVADRVGEAAATAPAPVVSVDVDEERGSVRLMALIADSAFEEWARRQAGAAPVAIDAVLRPAHDPAGH